MYFRAARAVQQRVHIFTPPLSAAQIARRYWRPAASDDALATKRYMGSAAVFSVTAASDSGSTAINAAERCLPTFPLVGRQRVRGTPHGPWVIGPTAIMLLQGADRGAIRACGAGKQ